MTEQLRLDNERDHPDNIISKVVSHTSDVEDIYFRVRWRGFTSELDTHIPGAQLATDAPDNLRQYFRDQSGREDAALRAYIDEYFPAWFAEQRTRQQRRVPGATAPGRRGNANRRTGRTYAEAAQQPASQDRSTEARAGPHNSTTAANANLGARGGRAAQGQTAKPSSTPTGNTPRTDNARGRRVGPSTAQGRTGCETGGTGTRT